MNNNYDQKERLVIEKSFRMRDEGSRLSNVIEKFPEYKAEIREIFGIGAFIKENKDKISAPKNILKTILSKLPDNFRFERMTESRDEPAFGNHIALANESLSESSAELPIFESESIPIIGNSKWKVAVPIIILFIILGIFLMRKDSTEKNTAENTSTSTQEMNASMLTGSINDALPSIGQE